jgi:hypothetical protein
MEDRRRGCRWRWPFRCRGPRRESAVALSRPNHTMKHSTIALILVLLCAACAAEAGLKEVGFEWFNLSTNQIWVTELVGLPAQASAGRLMPSHAEDQLESSESFFPETVRVGKKIKIVWKDNGTQGWPGGLKVPESVPPGATHEAEFSRYELGIPAKLSSGKVRFTYLGDGKWRVKHLSENL